MSEFTAHPAAEMFPLMVGPEFDDLVADISEHGLREPIVLTTEGQLLDGRNRYRACRKLGDVPATRVEHSEPWAYVISTNVHRRHLNTSQRAFIAARIAERSRGGAHGNQYAPAKPPDGGLAPPTHDEAAALLNVGTTSVSRARRVLRDGVPGLAEAVQNGQMPVATAARVAEEMEPGEQEEFVRKVNNGANPRTVAPPDSEQTRRIRARKQNPPTDPLGGVSPRSPKRHQYITAAALAHLRNTFEAFNLVLDSAPEGLDPAITNEQAAQWLDGLSKESGSYRRIVALLKQRKESTQ